MVLLANVDILTLYAVCGLVLTLFTRLPASMLAVAGLSAIYLPVSLPFAPPFPNHTELQNWAITATQHYSRGNFADILSFRWQETRALIAPILIESAPNTAGMMLLGLATWKSGIIRNSRLSGRTMWPYICVAGALGLLNTIAELLPRIGGNSLKVPAVIGFLGSHVPLALAYAACLLAITGESALTRWTKPFAAAGQMALTNYLAQSMVFGLVFYGYGGGLFGSLAPAPVAGFGIIVYTAQLFFSQWWLSRYRFGPVEWLWRSATYGRFQPMALR